MSRGAREDLERGKREVSRGRETYVPPTLLQIPDFEDTGEFVYRWIRVSLGGQIDAKNINMRLREGWTFVRLEDLPDAKAYAVVDSQKGSSLLENIVQVGDVALAKLPRAKDEAYKRYIDQLSSQQMAAYSQKDVKAQVDGHQVYLDNESRSRVTRGLVDMEA